jgi:two-component system chemotaxis response regulator CheB
MERALAKSRDRQPASRPAHRRIRLMIVDDSMVARAVLSRMIESDPAFEIAAVAGTAEDAIDALGQVQVDIVLLDLEMPGLGGLNSIPRILDAAGGAKVMIVSSLAEEGAEETVAALALGAADTLPKPGTGRFNGRFSEVLLGRLKALGFAQKRDPVATAPAPCSAPERWAWS